MNTILISTIRTFVPALVGQLVAWLLTFNIVLDTATVTALETGLISLLGAVLTGAYYFVVRKLAQKYPRLEALLGSAKAPTVYESK